MKPVTRTLAILGSAGAIVAASILVSNQRGFADLRPVPTPQLSMPYGVVKPPVSERHIQIALLLDTSSSMDGLIAQAKSQLWKVVNEFARAKKDGKAVRLEIALYEYGKSTLSPESGWIRQITPFTTDLDRISEELFGLTTGGGEEYCGQVIRTAVKDLTWSANPDDLKLIFIAGNEPFTQGPVTPAAAIAGAAEKGIKVNTIHCGGDDASWRDAAALAHGGYMMIDQNRAVVHIAAPQDDEIARLGVELNGTYLAYGAHGRVSAERQKAQDANAQAAAPGSMMARAVSKSSGLYSNGSWDLVDAARDGVIDLAKIAEGDLPEELRKLTPDQRKAYVEAKQAERKALQGRIQALNAERQKFVEAEQKKRGLAGDDTLDAALVKLVHEQGEKAGWRFE